MKNGSPNKTEVSTFKAMKGSGGGEEVGEILEASLVEERIPEGDLWHLRQRDITHEGTWSGLKTLMSENKAKSIRYHAERVFAISVATLCLCLFVAIIIVMVAAVIGLGSLFKGFATGEIPMH